MRTLGYADVFRIVAFAQLTWRESLRDIEVCLAANQTKLFHMGLQAPLARAPLADALHARDWRIYHALAQRPRSLDAPLLAALREDRVPVFSVCNGRRLDAPSVSVKVAKREGEWVFTNVIFGDGDDLLAMLKRQSEDRAKPMTKSLPTA